MMTEDNPKGSLVHLAPSRTETNRFRELLIGGHHNLVMTHCMFEGKERIAVGTIKMADREGEDPKIRLLAILINENDVTPIPGEDGETVLPDGVELLLN